MSCKNRSKKKAFTLIELLIVIAIIGILFIVLVSKVDFATDKAKATGVQTDFRSFQLAFDTVAKENAGFNTFGWDTGDTNGNRIRDSYDKGDTNKNDKQDPGEVFIGSKTYGETWTNIYTLTNPADADDKSAIVALEEAINANLDPKLHITIHDDLTITMANGAQDPWKTEYHGIYLSNAFTDNMDRGAIVIFSNGANQEFGTKVKIEKGVVTAIVSLIDANTPDNNIKGKDDYVLAIVYTYTNGYGETAITTKGFSNNQIFLTGNSGSESGIITGNYECGHRRTDPGLHSKLLCGHYTCDNCGCVPASCGVDGHWSNDGKDHTTIVWHIQSEYKTPHKYACQCESWTVPEGTTYHVYNAINGQNDFVAGEEIPCGYFPSSYNKFIDDEYEYIYYNAGNTQENVAGWHVTKVLDKTKTQYKDILSEICGRPVTGISSTAFSGCSNMVSLPKMPESLSYFGGIETGIAVFGSCTSLTSITLHKNIKGIGWMAFSGCSNLITINFEGTVEQWNAIIFGKYWNNGVPATYVQCSDGTVSLK